MTLNYHRMLDILDLILLMPANEKKKLKYKNKNHAYKKKKKTLCVCKNVGKVGFRA